MEDKQIVYYKGIEYYLEEDKGEIVNLVQVSNPLKKCIAIKSNILTKEQYEEKLAKGNLLIDSYNNSEKRRRYM